VEDAALDLGLGPDRDGWRENAAIHAPVDDDLARDNVALDASAFRDYEPERRDPTPYQARNNKLAIDFEHAPDSGTPADDRRQYRILSLRSSGSRALDLGSTSQF
jgi:hypothetical protein